MTHEINMKSNKEGKESIKNKGIAFKALSSNVKEEIKDDDNDEEMSLFRKRFNKMFKRVKFPIGQERRNFNKEEEPEKDPIICYECKKLGHINVEC